MHRLVAVLLLGATTLSADSGAQPGPGVSRRAPAWVAVVRRPGVQTYEQLIEEFRSQVLAAVRVVGAHDGDEDVLRQWLQSYRPGVVVAVGQRAYQMVRDTPVPLVSVLALHAGRTTAALRSRSRSRPSRCWRPSPQPAPESVASAPCMVPVPCRSSPELRPRPACSASRSSPGRPPRRSRRSPSCATWPARCRASGWSRTCRSSRRRSFNTR